MKTKKPQKLIKKITTIGQFTRSSVPLFPTDTTLGTDPTNTTITTITTVNTHSR